MAEQFYTILTKTGKAKIANSLPTGQKVNLTKMKIGDSNGTYYNPSENQTELVHKVYECNVTSVEVDEINPSWITITAAIPSDVGGFSIREVGIFDDSNSLIAIGKYPETYKPVASDGSTKELYIKMTLEVTNAASVELKIDPTVILATKKDISNLDAKIEQNSSQLNQNANAIEILNKKDLRTNIHLTDATIFSPTLTSSHECWNKWVSVEGNNMEYAPHPGALWGEVFTGGTSTRAFQIFISVFDSAKKIYVRYKHDSAWSEFRFIATGFLKEMTLLNGWVKLDMTPTLSLNGNTLTVNARIKSGVTSANTLIAETGLFASSGGSTFHNCYTPTGQLLGTLVYTSEGTIKIFNELSSNADVCFNFSVSVN